MQSIHEASAGKIRALLTDDQKATWDRMQERRKQHMGDKQGAAPPPPQQ
jgi:hypothetical protein